MADKIIRDSTVYSIESFYHHMHQNVVDSIIKTHGRGFFDTELHVVSWHFATHEAVRPSGF